MGIPRLSDFRQFLQGPSQRPDSDSKSCFICYFAPFQKCSAILDHPSGRWNSAQSHCLSLLGLTDAALVFASGCPEPRPFAVYLLLVCVCVCVCVCVHMLVSQLCRLFGTSYLLYPWNSPRKNTELGAISSWLRDQILVSHIVGRFFTVWATREAQECLYMCKHLMWTTNSLEKTLMLGTTGGRRRRGWQSMWWLIAIINSMAVSLSNFQEIVKDRETWCAESMGSQRVRHSWAMEQQQ